MTPATFDDRVNDRTAFSGVGVSEEQPVLLSKGGWSDRIFNQIVVDFDPRILKINLQRLPLIQGVVDGFAHRTLRQEASDNVPPLEDPTDSFTDEPALAAAICITQRGTGSVFA
jgi:hypothetical protein